MFRIHHVVALFFAVALMLPAAADADPTVKSEKLYYDISWGYAKVAEMKLHLGCQRASYRPAALVAKSLGIANQIHAFSVRLDSFMDPDGGASLEGRTKIHEDGFTRSFKSRFSDRPAVRVTQTTRGKTKTDDFALPGSGHDLLSWMLDLRKRELRKGAAFSYLVWDGWKLARVTAKVTGVESVWTEMGVKKAHAVELERRQLHHKGEKAFQNRGDVEELGAIWFSTDASRTPVAMDFLAPVGKAKIVLARKVVGRCASD